MTKNTQFGTPITINNGGINAIMIDNWKLNKAILPSAQITETNTTRLHCMTIRKDRKKMYKSKEEAKTESPRKIYISLTIRLPITTRICGSPAKCGFPKYLEYDSTSSSISNTTFDFFLSARYFSSIPMSRSETFVLSLYNNPLYNGFCFSSLRLESIDF